MFIFSFHFFYSTVYRCSMRQFGSGSLAHMQVHLFIKGVIVVVPYIPIMRIISLNRVSKRWPQGKSYDSQLRMFFTYFNGWKNQKNSTSWHIKLYRLVEISVSINKIPCCTIIHLFQWLLSHYRAGGLGSYQINHMSPKQKYILFTIWSLMENLLIPGLIQ